MTKYVLKNNKGYLVWAELYGMIRDVGFVDHPCHAINNVTLEEAKKFLEVLKPVGDGLHIVEIVYSFVENVVTTT